MVDVGRRYEIVEKAGKRLKRWRLRSEKSEAKELRRKNSSNNNIEWFDQGRSPTLISYYT